MQELNFTTTDPVWGEHTITLSSGDTQKVLELGEILVFKAESNQGAEQAIPALKRLYEETGKFIIILFPGQELQNVALTTE